jgi:hypothetical protein
MDANKIKIAVCGDSFCTACTEDLVKTGAGNRAHFSQILEDVYDYEVLHLAHGGFSNTAIAFQIQEAVNQQVDVIVYNQTWSARFEFVRSGFDDQRGLKNFCYHNVHHPSTHSNLVGTQDSPVLSTVWQGAEQNALLSSEQVLALKLRIRHMFDEGLQQIIDGWLLDYWHKRSIEHGILPIKFNDEAIAAVAYRFSENNIDYDTPFHTDRATQEIVAANIDQYIKDNCNGHHI